MHNRIYSSPRLYIIFLLFIFLFLAICSRLIYIQIFNKQFLTKLADKQHNVCLELKPRRGIIYDCNLKPQTANINLESLFAVAGDIPSNKKLPLALKLSKILGISDKKILKKLYTEKSFVWIARKLPPELADKIRELKVRELNFVKEPKRSYPNGELAAHILGYVGLDNYGLEGLELLHEKYLRGTPGKAVLIRDASRKTLPLLDEFTIPPKDGFDLVLTIDESIQYIAERELDKAFKKYNAKGASIIVMDPFTGKILALANRPAFNPNQMDESSKDSKRNRALCDFFEPGSVFKIVTAAAALEEGAVKENDVFFCENGEYRVANHVLHDHEPYGNLTFSEVIQYSSNIGTTKVAQLLGPQKLYRYIKLFGFGDLCGIDFPGEVPGITKDPKVWSKTSIGAVPIGQEVCVTALQLAQAISAIANGGWVMKPFLVERIQDKIGEVIKEFNPSAKRKIISNETAKRLTAILIQVVEKGTGKSSKIQGYKVAGKTGTAQKIEANGTYSHSKFMASFMGFVPADNPKLTIVVTVDEPHPLYYGGVVAAPVFKNVANDVLRYLEIPPALDQKNEVAKANQKI